MSWRGIRRCGLSDRADRGRHPGDMLPAKKLLVVVDPGAPAHAPSAVAPALRSLAAACQRAVQVQTAAPERRAPVLSMRPFVRLVPCPRSCDAHEQRAGWAVRSGRGARGRGLPRKAGHMDSSQ